LRLVVDIPEAYSLNLKEGSTLTFTVNALPGREFKGKISRRSGNMNQQFRSEIAEIDIDNKAQTFRPGMFAEIILEANGHAGALAVPASAVVSSTERQYVIKVEEGRAKHIEVRRGHRAGDQVEVFGNLRAEDNIIVNAREDIREGSTVL
jgi:membrane fusion protein, multidrug efflux system